MSTVDVEDVSLSIEQSVKCFGIISHQISQARHQLKKTFVRREAFFAHRSIGIFQGLLNPLSSCSIF